MFYAANTMHHVGASFFRWRVRHTRPFFQHSECPRLCAVGAPAEVSVFMRRVIESVAPVGNLDISYEIRWGYGKFFFFFFIIKRRVTHSERQSGMELG